MSSDAEKFSCLLEELETSRELIKAGFGGLQEIDVDNIFYHLPHQLIASGFERLMKCYISLVYEGQQGSYPDLEYMKQLGHDLEALLKKICTEFYGGKTRPFVQKEFDFITTDPILQECIRILSSFGQKGRYYNLDIVAGSPESPISPEADWTDLELYLGDMTLFLNYSELLDLEYYPRIHSQFEACLGVLLDC